MAYAILSRAENGAHVLVDESPKALERYSKDGYMVKRVAPDFARLWVKRGNVHQTTLWVDFEGKVRKS